MAIWLPAAKIILPHLADIVSVAVPAFTKRKSGATSTADVQQQITELQTAATQNATNIKELAEQLELTVRSLEEAAAAAQQKMQRAWLLALVGFGCGSLALVLALLGLIAR